MQLQRFHDVQDFWQAAEAFFLQHEAENSWLTGIVQTLRHRRDRYPRELYLVLVQDKGCVLAAAVQISPYKLLLSKAQTLDALAMIAQDLRLNSLSGVAGLAAEVDTFVQSWRTFRDQTAQQILDLRVYELTSVPSMPKVNGTLRLATEADRPMPLK